MSITERDFIVLCKHEATPGVDPGDLAAVDYLPALSYTGPDHDPVIFDDAEGSGGYGAGEHQVGSIGKKSTEIRVPLRGPGWAANAAVAPELSRVLRSAGWLETIAAAALPSTSVSDVSAGTTTSLTIDRTLGNGTQWPATTGALVGQPVELSVNPAVTITDIIEQYVVTGNNAVLTLSSTYGVALSTATKVKRLSHVLYTLGNAAIPTAALWMYRNIRGSNSLLQKLLGVQFDTRFDVTPGGRAEVICRASGIHIDDTDAAPPTITRSTVQPSILQSGLVSLNRTRIATAALSFGTNNAGFYDPDGNAENGFAAYEVTKRSVSGSVAKKTGLVATDATIADWKNNVIKPFAMIIGARSGGIVGARWGLLIPRAKYRGVRRAPDGDIMRDTIEWQSADKVNEAYLCVY